MPQISVIIPIHNMSLYMRHCVDSVRNQTLQDLEIILVDNLSSDDSPLICDEYAQLDSRIKVLHLNESGLSIARNAGIDIASAPYIGFIDSDDYIEPNMYEVMLNSIEKYQAGAAYCNLCYEFEDGSACQLYPNTGNISLRLAKDVQCDIILDKVSSSSCTKLFRKELFENKRFPVGMYFEDHSTMYRWLGECDKVVWVDISFYHYLQRSDSICHTIDVQKRFQFFLAEYDRLDFIEEHRIFDEKNEFEARNFIIRNCIQHINEYIKIRKTAVLGDSLLFEMRKMISKCLKYSKQELTKKNYNRLRKISYFWLFYYYTHRS